MFCRKGWLDFCSEFSSILLPVSWENIPVSVACILQNGEESQAVVPDQ